MDSEEIDKELASHVEMVENSMLGKKAKKRISDEKMDTDENQQKRQKNEQEQLELANDDHLPSLEHLNCLITRFKHSQFRNKQWEIIRTVMIEKRDVCAVMATCHGKSLCFQVYFTFIFTIFYSYFTCKSSTIE